MASKSRSTSSSKSGQKGRGTSGGRAQPKKSAAGSSSSRRAESVTTPKAESAARTPGLDVGAVDRLVKRVNEALPKGRARSAFSGTTPMSPNAVTLFGSMPAVLIVGVSVATHSPLLLAGAAATMVLTILVLMRGVNSTCVVAELPGELVVFTNGRDGLELRSRGPVEVSVLPYRDRRWLRVEVAGDQLWVSRRAFGVIVDRLAAAGDESDG